MSWQTSVFSSNVSEIGYDDETGEMTVLWNSGKTSGYVCPEDVALAASKAPSVGQFLNTEIKPFYPHRYR